MAATSRTPLRSPPVSAVRPARRPGARPIVGARSLGRPLARKRDADAPAELPDDEVDSAPSRPARDDDKASFLAKYFRDMSALAVLKPEEEFGHARRIEALEIQQWRELLAYAPATEYVLGLIEARLDNSLTDFRALRRLAREARSHKAAQAKLEAASQKLGGKLRAIDSDRINLEAVTAEVHRLGLGHGGRVARQPQGFSLTSAGARTWRGRVSAAERAAAAARSAFVLANLRLVVSIARRFNHGRMALADLIQEGNIGLMKAVERYDYTRGFRFSTYASWWIRHAISRALADKGRAVRLPVHMIDAYHRIAKARRELSNRLGRQPTSDELAKETSIAAAKIEKMRTFLVDQSYSLDRPVSDDDGRSFIELLQDPDADATAPADRMANEEMTDEVQRLLADLKPIEQDILRQRFGFADDKELTLKEIGEKYNLSRERIRQLQEQALDKMRRALGRKEML